MNNQLIILIDSGSTHSFLDAKLAALIGIKIMGLMLPRFV
jgi:hypothetical protein